MNEQHDHAAGWAFALQHASTIKRFSGRFWRPWMAAGGYTPEDFHSDLVVAVATHHHGYRPEASSPATWLWWRARKVQDKVARRLHRTEVPLLDGTLDAWATTQATGCATMEHRAEVVVVLGKASAMEREAADVLALDLGDEQTYATIGIGLAAARKRIAGLAARLEVRHDHPSPS